MKTVITFLSIIFSLSVQSQFSIEYQVKVAEGDSLYDLQEYKKSAQAYSTAFAANKMVFFIHRYNAACSYALSNNIDSAFFHLFHIVTQDNYGKLDHIKNDADLLSLHADPRWNELIKQVAYNKSEKDKYLEPELIAMLDSVYRMDQDILNEQNKLATEFGWESDEVKALESKKDSLYKITRKLVTDLLDKRGWLGSAVIGSRGNSTLFLVIQHAPLETQLKYLPMMRQAVEERRASRASFALLVDRTNLKTGKKQLYGSQIGRLPNQSNFVRALEDPLNVDKRRAEMSLEPLNDYTQNWNFTFDPEEYLKELPKYEEILKKEYEASLEIR